MNKHRLQCGILPTESLFRYIGEAKLSRRETPSRLCGTPGRVHKVRGSGICHQMGKKHRVKTF
jgi:hypothetical protein